MISLSDGRTKLYQWDTDVKLNIPQGIAQVHFANNVYSRAFVIDVVNGQVILPPELLQTDKPLKVWGFVPTENGGYTKIEKVFEVKKKNRPNDYVYTPTEQIKLADAVETAEEALKKAEEVEKKLNEGDFGGGGDGKDGKDGFSPTVQVVEISGGHRVSITDAERTNSFDVMDGKDGTDGHDGDDGRGIISIEKTSSDGLVDTYTITYTDNTASTFTVTNGKDGAKGDKGEDGEDGEDGFSPTIEVQNISNGHRISITDKNGPKNVDVVNGTNGADGHTPVRGIDYWTETDKSEIINDVIAQLPETPGAESVNPDWNENDETQPDYIKNRTHYVEVTSTRTNIYQNENISITTGGSLGIGTSIGPDLVYCLTINGNEYVSEPTIFDDAVGRFVAYFEDGYYLSQNVTDPFALLGELTAGTYSISVDELTVEETVVQIPMKFLPIPEIATLEEWTFELEDGSTVTKKVALYD